MRKCSATELHCSIVIPTSYKETQTEEAQDHKMADVELTFKSAEPKAVFLAS